MQRTSDLRQGATDLLRQPTPDHGSLIVIPVKFIPAGGMKSEILITRKMVDNSQESAHSAGRALFVPLSSLPASRNFYYFLLQPGRRLPPKAAKLPSPDQWMADPIRESGAAGWNSMQLIQSRKHKPHPPQKKRARKAHPPDRHDLRAEAVGI